jgi:hypothetical protein
MCVGYSICGALASANGINVNGESNQSAHGCNQLNVASKAMAGSWLASANINEISIMASA